MKPLPRSRSRTPNDTRGLSLLWLGCWWRLSPWRIKITRRLPSTPFLALVLGHRGALCPKKKIAIYIMTIETFTLACYSYDVVEGALHSAKTTTLYSYHSIPKAQTCRISRHLSALRFCDVATRRNKLCGIHDYRMLDKEVKQTPFPRHQLPGHCITKLNQNRRPVTLYSGISLHKDVWWQLEGNHYSCGLNHSSSSSLHDRNGDKVSAARHWAVE